MIRNTPLKRTAFKAKQSAKVRRFNADFKLIRPSILERGCEFHAAMEKHPNVGSAIDFPLTCSGAMQAHHRIPRSDVGRCTNTPWNLICLCLRHHAWVHDGDPAAAREIGLLD